jgi:hypothetical protein
VGLGSLEIGVLVIATRLERAVDRASEQTCCSFEKLHWIVQSTISLGNSFE